MHKGLFLYNYPREVKIDKIPVLEISDDMVSELKTFCCGFSLKTGTIVIGVIQSILAFMFMSLSAAYSGNPHELIDMSDPSILPNPETLRLILIIIAVASALQCAFGILLIFGAETNRPLLFLPWLVFNPICILTYIVGTLVAILHHKAFDNTTFITIHLLLGMAVCLIGAYKVAAVYSYFKHLRSLNF